MQNRKEVVDLRDAAVPLTGGLCGIRAGFGLTSPPASRVIAASDPNREDEVDEPDARGLVSSGALGERAHGGAGVTAIGYGERMVTGARAQIRKVEIDVRGAAGPVTGGR